MHETAGMEDVVVRGVALKRDLAAVVLIGVPNEPGMASKIFGHIAEQNIVVDDIIQNIYEDGKRANVGFTVASSDLSEARALGDRLSREFGFRGVEVDEGVAKVSIVGIGMRSHTGVAGKMFDALYAADINIEHISTSEIVVSCVVRQEDGEKALKALHTAFGLDKNQGNEN